MTIAWIPSILSRIESTVSANASCVVADMFSEEISFAATSTAARHGAATSTPSMVGRRMIPTRRPPLSSSSSSV